MRGLPSAFMQIRCNFPDILYLSGTQKNNFQFLNETKKRLKPLHVRLTIDQTTLVSSFFLYIFLIDIVTEAPPQPF